MLILGRRVGDSILIEGGIRIVVVSCDRGGVRIGIEAPPDLKILRGEIAQQVASENQRATAGNTTSEWAAALGIALPTDIDINDGAEAPVPPQVMAHES